MVLVAVLVAAAGCGKRKTGGSAGATESGAPGQIGNLATALPGPCEQYRHKLLRCMESSHFPPSIKDGQRLALQQMLAVVTEEQRRGDPTGAGLAAATENCRDSLSTLEESAKVTCPEAF